MRDKGRALVRVQCSGELPLVTVYDERQHYTASRQGVSGWLQLTLR